MKVKSINHLIKRLLHPILLKGTKWFDKCRLNIVNTEHVGQIPTPAIFVANHSNGHDFPVAAQCVRKHFYILADYTMKKDFVVNVLNRLNGCVYVDRKNPNSKKQSKEKLIEHLKCGHTILLFPEGTWNLRPSKLLLPLNWGVIDISKETNVPIVPITIVYWGNQGFANIGKPFLPTVDKQIEILNLEEQMSSLLWETISLYAPLNRSDIPDNFAELLVKEQLATYKKLDLQYETSVIRNTDNDDDAFAHLNTLCPTIQTAFLFNKRLK